MVHSSTDKSIADVQRYWDARPCNIRHSTKPIGSREYFDEVEARKYFIFPPSRTSSAGEESGFSRWAAASVPTRSTSPAPALT
jgi:hypothetical protein